MKIYVYTYLLIGVALSTLACDVAEVVKPTKKAITKKPIVANLSGITNYSSEEPLGALEDSLIRKKPLPQKAIEPTGLLTKESKKQKLKEATTETFVGENSSTFEKKVKRLHKLYKDNIIDKAQYHYTLNRLHLFYKPTCTKKFAGEDSDVFYKKVKQLHKLYKDNIIDKAQYHYTRNRLDLIYKPEYERKCKDTR